MRYAVTFLIFAGVLAALSRSFVGVWAIPPAWCALSFGIIGLGYAGLGPCIFLKTKSGKLPGLSYLLLWPVHLINFVGLALFHRASERQLWVQVDENLMLGCRLPEREASDLVSKGIVMVVDLAAELSEANSFRQLAGYRNVSVLDTRTPERERFSALVSSIQLARRRGTVYVHCALGHGRSATVVAGCLLESGRAISLEEAESFLRALRPGVEFKPDQRRLLEEVYGESSRAGPVTRTPLSLGD